MFMYLVFIHMKGENYHRQLRSLLCLWCLSSTNELPCLLICTGTLGLVLFWFSFCSPAQFTWDKVVLWTDSFNTIIMAKLWYLSHRQKQYLFLCVTFYIWNVIWAKTSFGLLHFKWHTQNYSINDTQNYCHKWRTKLLPQTAHCTTAINDAKLLP